MSRVITSCCAVLLTALLTIAGSVADAFGDARAAELIAQARAALGGSKDAPLSRGVSCAGTVTRAIGDRRVSGDITLDLQLPDKLLRTETIAPMGDGTLIVTEQGINGETLLRSFKTMNAPPGAVIRTPPPPAAGSEAEVQAIRNSRAELIRVSIALLLSSAGAEFSYAGEAEAPDGKADVLDVKAAGGTAARLFLDKATHRPLMLSYRGIAPRTIVQTQHGGGPAGAAHEVTPPPAGETVDVTMFLDDYHAVDGVMLPHKISRAVGGETTEEWTFKTIKINPAFRSETFIQK